MSAAPLGRRSSLCFEKSIWYNLLMRNRGRFPNILLFVRRYKLTISLLFLVLLLWPNVAHAIAPLVVIGAIGAAGVLLKALGIGPGVLDQIYNVVTNLPVAILVGVPVMSLQLIVGIFTDIIIIVTTALNTVLKEVIQSTLEIPVVYGDPGSVLQIGRDFTLKIANMLLLVILSFIGLATTLRLQSYQLQKTLPALLLVALLINFSGLFVGFVVDSANLVINIFMKELTN